ncbi:MAG: hypothetical protein EOP85_00480 [Verrucomicrobiaceae bacterium]|nr:MAG: hypothetical protein EOP85_00480 [Verrucomicrobiaceae bacterium]
MKNKLSMLRLGVLSVILALAGSSVSCMTTYDANGRPVQSVDPALAVAGVAAAGLIGYAAADNHHHHGYYRGGYYRPYYGGYRGGYYRRGGHYHGGHYRR